MLTDDMDWWVLCIKILQTSVWITIVWSQTFCAPALPDMISFSFFFLIVLPFGYQAWTLHAEQQRKTADTIQPKWMQSNKRLCPKKTVSQPMNVHSNRALIAFTWISDVSHSSKAELLLGRIRWRFPIRGNESLSLCQFCFNCTFPSLKGQSSH